MTAPPLDGRLTENRVRVERVVIVRGWLSIRRADGPAGVVLEIRIPGYLNEDRPYPDQATAKAAGHAVWTAYREAADQAKAG